MKKTDEQADPDSCLNKALPDELIFVLLGRDACARWAVRFWAVLRVLRGKNRWRDVQIQEAFACARDMHDVRVPEWRRRERR